MKKLLILLFLSTLAFGVNYSEMSTQELISLMGYVSSTNEKKFTQELQKRYATMTSKEKKNYLAHQKNKR